MLEKHRGNVLTECEVFPKEWALGLTNVKYLQRLAVSTICACLFFDNMQ